MKVNNVLVRSYPVKYGMHCLDTLPTHKKLLLLTYWLLHFKKSFEAFLFLFTDIFSIGQHIIMTLIILYFKYVF